MFKIAKSFFEKGKTTLPKNISFEDTDLFIYLKIAYGETPIFSHKDGFIKVTKDDKGNQVLSEHIFFDEFIDTRNNCLFITFNKLEGKLGRDIEISKIGYDLYKKGYAIIDIPYEYQQLVLRNFKKLNFIKTPEAYGINEPYATFKYHDSIWGFEKKVDLNSTSQMIYSGMDLLISEVTQFSSVLKSLDSYDLNVLHWKKGRSMDAHNGVDYRSIINLITYDTDNCFKSRDLMVGEYDWYDTVFQCLASLDFEPLMNITKGLNQINSIPVTTNKGILVNVFNPKFYHQVGEMKSDGDLYVCTSNKSWRSLVSNFDFKW